MSPTAEGGPSNFKGFGIDGSNLGTGPSDTRAAPGHPASMRWASALAVSTDSSAAIDAALVELDQGLDHNPADLVIVFASPQFDAHLPGLYAQIRGVWPDAHLLGCTAAGVIGGNQELESAPALSLTAASLPGVQIEPFHVLHRQLPAADAPADAWRRILGIDDDTQRHAIVLPDPFSMDVGRLVAGIEEASPLGVLLGGTASGGTRPGEHRLLIDDQVHRAGAAGVLLSGNLAIDTVVSQGCRPVGAPFFVTRCRGNVVTELDGQPALEAMQAMISGLSPSDAALCKEALYVGLVMDPGRQAYGPGDFLIRYVIGVDSRTGALVLTARPTVNAVMQFHVRDAAASAADLSRLLQRTRAGEMRPPAGALLFDCVGRGERFFGMPEHDTGLIRAEFGGVPIGGFFCSGEIGPVRGKTHLHGYTAALGLFRPRLDS